MKKTIITAIITILIITIGVMGILLWQKKKMNSNSEWISYASDRFGISFNYPSHWHIRETNERIYMSNIKNQMDKPSISENFQQLWISTWPEEIKAAENYINGSIPEEARRLVSSEIIKKDSFVIRTYEYQGEGGPSLLAFWRDESGKKYFATNATEVGLENQKNMIENLKLILKTIEFNK